MAQKFTCVLPLDATLANDYQLVLDKLDNSLLKICQAPTFDPVMYLRALTALRLTIKSHRVLERLATHMTDTVAMHVTAILTQAAVATITYKLVATQSRERVTLGVTLAG